MGDDLIVGDIDGKILFSRILQGNGQLKKEYIEIIVTFYSLNSV